MDKDQQEQPKPEVEQEAVAAADTPHGEHASGRAQEPETDQREADDGHEQQGKEAEARVPDEEAERIIDEKYNELPEDLRKRLEDDGLKDDAREVIGRVNSLRDVGPVGPDAELTPEEAAFRERLADEESLHDLTWHLAKEKMPSQEEMAKQKEAPSEANVVDDNPELTQEAQEKAEKAMAAAKEAVESPTPEHTKAAHDAMADAYDPELVKHLENIKPWWQYALVTAGLVFYTYVGLQYATANMAEAWGKANSK